MKDLKAEFGSKIVNLGRTLYPHNTEIVNREMRIPYEDRSDYWHYHNSNLLKCSAFVDNFIDNEMNCSSEEIQEKINMIYRLFDFKAIEHLL